MLKAGLSFGRLNKVPQGATIVILGFLPILAIVSMFPAVPSMIAHFAQSPDARWKVPIMVSAPGLSIALLAPVAGIIADKIGRRAVLLAATLLYGIVGSLPFLVDSMNAVILCRLALGVTEAFILTGVNALIGDYWNDTERRAWLSIQGMLGPFLSFGLVIASGQITRIAWNGAFLIYLVAFPIFVMALLTLFEPTKDGATAAELSRREAIPAFPWPSVLLTGAVTFAMALLYYVFIINGGLVFKEAGIVTSNALGNLTALPSLFVILGSYIFWMLRLQSNAVQLMTAFATLGGGLLLMGALHTVPAMLAGLVIQQTGAGMAVPALIAWTQLKLPFEHRGRGMGAWTTCFFLGQFVSPAIVHQLDNVTGSMHGAFFIAGCTGLIAATIALIAAERGSRQLPAAIR